MSRALLLVFAVVLVGCGGFKTPEPDSICFDINSDVRREFPRAEHELREAVESWGGKIDQTPFCPNDIRITQFESDNLARSDRFGDGYGYPTWARIEINSRSVDVILQTGEECSIDRDESWLVTVLAHELGHVFGIPGHSESGLMQAPLPHCEKPVPSEDEIDLVGL